MIISIINQREQFRRMHGKSPNVLYLSKEHYKILRREYAELFSGDDEASSLPVLGLKLVMVPGDLVQHPTVACALPGMSRIFHCEDREERTGSRTMPIALQSGHTVPYSKNPVLRYSHG